MQNVIVAIMLFSKRRVYCWAELQSSAPGIEPVSFKLVIARRYIF